METLKITSDKKIITINFPGGAGGNWLCSIIDFAENSSIENHLINFHNTKKCHVNYIHSLDTTGYDYIFSGKSIFNFYLNVVHKFYQYERNITNKDYQTRSKKYFEVSRFLFDFINVNRSIDLNFDDLVSDNIKFYNKIIDVQQAHNLITIPHDEFLYRKSKFFKTCVNPDPVFKNFDNPVWVFFLLGILDRIDISPSGQEHFYMFQEEDFNRAKNFVFKYFYNVPDIVYYKFDTDVFFNDRT